MNVIRQIHKVNAIPPRLPEGNYLVDRIGFWAIVTAQNSLNNTVSVLSDTGFVLENIPVMSREWVTVDDQKNYIPSQRNLPPKNSRVFVLTPTYTATGAFVLCSGFSRGDDNIRTLWAQNDSELEDKNNCRETKTQGGWDIQEEYSNGNFSAVSNDGNIKIIANTEENGDKEQSKEVAVKAWGSEIIIYDNEIIISDTNGNVVDLTSDGILLKDKNKNSVEMSDTGIEIAADTSKKIKIGNNTDTIKGILSDILTILNSSLATAGSPANHTVVPGQFSAVITKLNQVLG